MSGSFSSWVFAALILVLAVVGSVLYLSPTPNEMAREARAAAWMPHPVGTLERVGSKEPRTVQAALGWGI